MSLPDPPDSRSGPPESELQEGSQEAADEFWTEREKRELALLRSAVQNRKRPGRRIFRFCRRFLVLCLILVLLAVAGVIAAAYFYRSAIRSEVEDRLMAELERQNIHLDYGDASFDFVRGLLLRDVKLYETSLRQKLLAECTELGFSFDAVDFVQQEFQGTVTTAFTARNAEVVFYEDGEAVATLEGLGATILGTDEGVSIEHFRGRIGQLDFDLDGEVRIDREARRKRAAEKPEREKEGRKIADFTFFHRLMPWLEVTKQNSEDPQFPEIRATFLVDPENENPVTVEGRFTGQDFIWRKIPLDAAAVAFAFQEGDKRLVLPDFNLIYAGGIISGEAIWDTGTNQVEVKRFQSSADLIDLVRHIDSGEGEFARGFRQEKPALISATGRLDLKQFWESDLLIDYRHADEVVLLLGEKELALEGIHGSMHVAGGGVDLKNVLVNVLGGKLELNGRSSMGRGPMAYEGTIDATGIPLQSIAGFFGSDQPLPGVLNLHYEGVAGSDFSAFNGRGNLRIDSGKLYRVPIVGPIQALMNSVTPMFQDENRGELTSTFVIRDGVMSTDDLTVVSDGTRLKVVGTIDLNNGQTQFEAEGNLVGALGLVTGLLSKALVVEGSGPINDLDMKLKTVPAEFASETVKTVFGAAGQGVNLVKDGAIKATGGVIETGTDAVLGVGQKTVDVGQKTVGEGARMIGEGIRRIIPGGQERDEGQSGGSELPPEVIPAQDEEKKRERGGLLRGLGPVFSDDD